VGYQVFFFFNKHQPQPKQQTGAYGGPAKNIRDKKPNQARTQKLVFSS
jgi:hypothetical protein